MNRLTSFIHFHNSKATTLDVILHGGSGGIDSPFMQKLFEHSKSKGNSVIMFNFPFLERGEDHSSGPELKEELKMLKQMLIIANAEDYPLIRLIGKSFGAIVASYYLKSLSNKKHKKFEIIILGFVVGDVKLDNFTGKITVVQGKKDKFGSIEVVKEVMKDTGLKNITYYEIPKADHSFRDPETKEPLYEDKVIHILSSL